MIRRLFALFVVLAVATGPALAERLVSTLSNSAIQITSSFAGEVLTLFGNIEPDTGSAIPYAEGPFNVVIVVEGPHIDRVARRKNNVAGVWVNTKQVTFESFPSFFHVLASGRLEAIAEPSIFASENIDPRAQARRPVAATPMEAAVFGEALIRIMTERGHFGVHEDGVRFLSDTAYVARLVLPNDIANGSFLARTYVFRGGELVAERAEGFNVRKIGFERFLFAAAVEQPFLYGIACVILAVFTGWIGGIVFRR